MASLPSLQDLSQETAPLCPKGTLWHNMRPAPECRQALSPKAAPRRLSPPGDCQTIPSQSSLQAPIGSSLPTLTHDRRLGHTLGTLLPPSTNPRDPPPLPQTEHRATEAHLCITSHLLPLPLPTPLGIRFLETPRHPLLLAAALAPPPIS